MNKRILATLCVTLFVLATLATVQQVSAHYTLGDQLPGSIGEVNAGGLPINPTSGAGNGELQFHTPPTWGGHVPGHIAFLMPGSLYIPPSDQVNYYSPDGAVLTDSVGDFFLYICLADDLEDGQSGPINISWRGTDTSNSLIRPPPSLYELSKYLYIAIPPEFTPPEEAWAAGWGDVLTTNQGFGNTSNIETTITNDHNMIMTGKFGPRHPVAPGWWFVRITAAPMDFPQDQVANLQNLNPNFNPKYTTDTVYRGSAGYLYPPNMDPWLDRQISPRNTNGIERNFAGCYRVKILNMKAPSYAGKYFFKIFYTSTYQPFASMGIQAWITEGGAATSSVYGTSGGWPDLWQAPDSPYGEVYNFDPWIGYLNGYFEKYDTFYPENYPVILVKGEVDPGYISGTVRYGGHSQYYYGTYYGDGVHTSGKVVAEGTALDPITNQPTGRPVSATGWFLGQLPGQGEDWKDRDTGSAGYYEIEGLAPGIYTLTAYAAGFVPRTLATQITVKRGQSIHGVDIYIYPTAKLQTKVYSKCPTGPVDWPTYVTLDAYPASMQILPVVPGGAEVRGAGPVGPDGVWYWATEGATTVQAKNIWADLTSTNAPGPWNPDPAALGAAMNTYDTQAEMNAIANRYGWAWQELVDANGTVVAWQDFTFDLAQDRRTFGTFWGDPSCYSGIETGWDGHVPTFLADFTSGIIPGQYRVRTWVYGYVQTKEYIVDFPAVEFPGTAYMEMDLFKGGTINATVHFHLQELPSDEVDVGGGTAGGFSWSALIIEAYDANGVKQAWNSTDFIVWENGDQSVGQSLLLVGEPNAWCTEGRVHGMPEGTYTIKAFMNGWIQQEFQQTTVQYCTNGSLSFHLIKGAGICVTIYSRDCQDPSQPVNWKHPGENIRLDFVSEAGSICAPDYGVRNWAVQDPTTDSVSICGGGGSGGLVDYFRSCGGFAGSGLPTGIYRIVVSTPGYVQLVAPEVWAQKGTSTGDIPVYLYASPEIRVVVDFKTELIPAPLPPDFYSYYFRIEAFNENGTLVAANITAVPQATWATYSQYPWPGALNPAQPGGVQSWVFQLQGFSPFSTPINKPNWGMWPTNPLGAVWFWQIPGYNDKGPKTIFMVANNSHANWGCAGTGDHLGYGLMWGEAYMIRVTEENQIGYIQLATVTATPTCGGITTVVFELDRMGRIAGQVYTRNSMGDFRAGSWQTTTAQGATASIKAWGPVDGWYYTYVRPDTYTVTAEGPGYKSASRTVVATWGGVTGGQDFYLEESGIPIPEFPAAGLLAMVSALAASLYLLRWRRHEALPVR
ncbi:carboxypeptidase regulatory-like domain-containing protein [Candidatus Bathyarchaeota archaeon]|nr:carboxypeptidase regulatory-like domain-containing protein [Candidatus Bathyarchaeota archaeon]